MNHTLGRGACPHQGHDRAIRAGNRGGTLRNRANHRQAVSVESFCADNKTKVWSLHFLARRRVKVQMHDVTPGNKKDTRFNWHLQFNDKSPSSPYGTGASSYQNRSFSRRCRQPGHTTRPTPTASSLRGWGRCRSNPMACCGSVRFFTSSQIANASRRHWRLCGQTPIGPKANGSLLPGTPPCPRVWPPPARGRPARHPPPDRPAGTLA